MKDVRTIVSENLTQLRKEKKLTQAELANKFNYSDKAISKWENGDTLPDLEILQELCTFYGVTLDYLTHEGSRKDKKEFVLDKAELKNHIMMTALIVTAAIMLATVLFVYSIIGIMPDDKMKVFWPVFVGLVPVMALLVLGANRIYFRNRLLNLLCFSIFMWGVIATIYTISGFFNIMSWGTLWPIFLIGIPIQGALGIWFSMKK